jgi:ankyrin repeat protein
MSFCLLLLSSWWMFGSFSFIQDQGILAGLGGLPGLLLGPNYGLLVVAPFWLVALAGVGPLRRIRPDFFLFVVLGFASLWLAAGLMSEWWGGTSPPARLLIPSLPLLVPFLALGLKRLEQGWKRWPAYVMVAWSFVVTIIFLFEPARMWVDPDKGLSLLPSSFDFATTRLARGKLDRAGVEVSQSHFMESVRKGDVGSVRLFLDAGSNPATALSEAARVGQAEMVELLLERVDPESIGAATALGWAQSRGHSECARILLEAGARLEARTRVHETALIRAAERGRLRVIRALVKAGADVNATTHAGVTALMFLAQSGHEMGARTLIRAGADVNAKDRDGWTPLMLAARAGEKDTVDILIAENAGVNDITVMGWTALLWAAYEGHLDVVEALLSAGANINYQSKAGQSALIRAAQKGHAEVVKRLVDSGADTSVTADGLDARAWAELHGHGEVVRELEEMESN